MDEIFALLQGKQASDLDEVFEQLYQELKRLARNCLGGSADGTLTPTSLVNEAYLKLTATGELSLTDQRHFFACAAKAMRYIVLDSARASLAGKRGGDQIMVTLTDPAVGNTHTDVLGLGAAMDALEQVNPDLHQLVDLRFFGGLSMEEVARIKETSVRTLQRDWVRAKAFLHAQLAT